MSFTSVISKTWRKAMSSDAAPPISILLVEDDDGVATAFTRALKGAGAKAVDRIVDLAHAREGFLTHRFACDVVILDLNLPDSRGYETLERFRAFAPDVPLVVWTGLEDPDDAMAIAASRLGVYEWISKTAAGASAGYLYRRCRMAVSYSKGERALRGLH